MTPVEAAEWMAETVRRDGHLEQSAAVYHLHKQDKGLTKYNESGNLAIDPTVLKAFGRLTKSDVVWSKSDLLWRIRTPRDQPGRRQD